MVSAFKFCEHIQQSLSAGATLKIYKGSGTNNSENVYLNLNAGDSFRNLVIGVSDEIFIVSINENELEDPIVVYPSSTSTEGGIKIDFSNTIMTSFQSIELRGGDAAAVISVLVM